MVSPFKMFHRFSPIDITVFREDIDQPATVEELEALSRKIRRGMLRCHQGSPPRLYQRHLLEQLQAFCNRHWKPQTCPPDSARLETDPDGRKFWDKVVILHGLRRWWEHRHELKGGGQRVSRHYYDVYRLLQSDAGTGAALMADGRRLPSVGLLEWQWCMNIGVNQGSASRNL